MTTFPEVREALTAEHTRPLAIKFRRDGSCYLSMGDHTKGTHKAFDIAFDGRYPPDVADAAAIEASYNAAPAMLAHIDAQAAEIERFMEALRGLLEVVAELTGPLECTLKPEGQKRVDDAIAALEQTK